ncbi:MAG: carbon-nitrogen hydrolase [Thermodesulfobacteriota bacterium]
MGKMKGFKAALIQMKMSNKKSENVSNAISKIEEACSNGADVICLPELFMTRYFCQSEDTTNFDLADKISDDVISRFKIAASKLKAVLILPYFEKRTSGVYHNSAAVIDSNGKITGTYRKMHIPDDPGYYEKYYFTPGDLGYKVFNTSCGEIGVLICWDQWFPEAARLVSLSGANIIFYPTAIGWHPGEKEEFGKNQLDAWKTVQRGHAIANGVFVASVNRIGFEENNNKTGIEFWGNSFLCDPQGVIISEASSNKEEIIYADIDLSILENTRRNWPFLRDRRIDSYQDLDKRFVDSNSK